ncbi:glycoside hydrolase family 51 protein [Oidiodendron maius Zn]|uniref:Glycoside hydrolase family 51 protein n=1 Tax=Oidiodendron maius (strain Zn) TaxID=913774 RepID=A0A0C3HCV9_OIDMZ|nr:glycoside hydrolase family 51 protein [Oidiodendron maius Zn]
MFPQWITTLTAVAAISGLASAGPKLPRSKDILHRKVTNTSSAVSRNILTRTGTRNATAPNLYGWMFDTEYNENPAYLIDIPAGAMWDTHHYEPPAFFIDGFDFWDNWQEETNNTNVTVFVSEYSVFQIDTPSEQGDFSNPPDIHIFYPRLFSAIAEGVYLLGAKRNPNMVKLTSYATSLQNWNCYYLQKLFNSYRAILGIDDQWKESVFLKVINVNSTTVPLTVSIETPWKFVNGTIITNKDVNGFNYKNNATAITAQPLFLENKSPSRDGIWRWNVP